MLDKQATMIHRPPWSWSPLLQLVCCSRDTVLLHSVWLKDFSHSILPCSYLFKSVPWMCSCTCSFLKTCGFPPEHPVARCCGKKKKKESQVCTWRVIFFSTALLENWPLEDDEKVHGPWQHNECSVSPDCIYSLVCHHFRIQRRKQLREPAKDNREWFDQREHGMGWDGMGMGILILMK